MKGDEKCLCEELYRENNPAVWDEIKDTGGKTFWGCMCTHFAVENLTEQTRCSLDFRIIPGNCYETDATKQLPDFKVGSYYSECHRQPPSVVEGGGGGGGGGGFVVTTRGHPSHRHGFPHTNK